MSKLYLITAVRDFVHIGYWTLQLVLQKVILRERLTGHAAVLPKCFIYNYHLNKEYYAILNLY